MSTERDTRILQAAQRLRTATEIRQKRAAELGAIESKLSQADAVHDSAVRAEQAATENLTKTVTAVTL